MDAWLCAGFQCALQLDLQSVVWTCLKLVLDKINSRRKKNEWWEFTEGSSSSICQKCFGDPVHIPAVSLALSHIPQGRSCCSFPWSTGELAEVDTYLHLTMAAGPSPVGRAGEHLSFVNRCHLVKRNGCISCTWIRPVVFVGELVGAGVISLFMRKQPLSALQFRENTVTTHVKVGGP